MSGMTEYYTTINERKNLARQARYRKRGSKSTKCPLSTDHMTRKQWEERNGPVMSYNLSKPMKWGEFKKLPEDSQVSYLEGLVSKYGATSAWISQMMGVGFSTMSRYTNRPGFGFKFKMARRPTQEQKVAWDAFVAGETCDKEQTQIPADTAPEVVTGEESQENQPVPVESSSQSEAVMIAQSEKPHKLETKMNQFSITFSGELNVDIISNSLRQILGRGSNGTINIVCAMD